MLMIDPPLISISTASLREHSSARPAPDALLGVTRDHVCDARIDKHVGRALTVTHVQKHERRQLRIGVVVAVAR